MKKTLTILFATLSVCLFAGCGSGNDDDGGGSPQPTQLAGEWHIASWNGAAVTEFDTYLSFSAAGSFEIYQQIEQSNYQKFTGSYQFRDKTLSGKYSDNSAWSSSYEISFDEPGNTLTMLSEASMGEVSVYKRMAIPESIKGVAKVVKSTRSAGRLPL